MTKSRSEPVKKHFTEVGDSGRADKGNKQRICDYCDKHVAETARRARDHFLKGSRCDVERLRGVVPREKYSMRLKGRLAARSELGVIMGEIAEGESSEDDNEQQTVEVGVVDRSKIAAGLRRATPQSSTGVVGLRQTTIEDSVVVITLDGWIDHQQRPHINVMVSFPKGSIFWRSVCISRRNKGASAYCGILKRAIEEIVAEAVVGVVMDNVVVCAAAGRMVEADYPHIFSVSCTTHSRDLIFESFAKITWVGEVIKRASEVAKFFTNLSRVRDLLIHYSNGGVVAKPGATRFAMNFIMFSSLQGLYLPLRTVTHVIFNDTFWADIEKVMRTSKHLLKLLKLVDGTGPRMDSAVEKLRESTHFTEAEKDELEVIIMRRWNTMTSPLHCAALFLDPEYRASRPETDAEIVDGFWRWLYSWCKEAAYMEVDVEVCDEEVEDVEGGHLEGGPAPARATRKRGRPWKAPVEEEEAGTRRGTRKRERLQMQPAEEEVEAALENTSSADKHGSNDGSSSSDESGVEHDENDGSGRSGGARDGSGSNDESEGGRGSRDGGEKDGRSSEEEDDSECEGRKEDGSSSEAEDDSEWHFCWNSFNS
ncbi:hypothetical protein CBR_g39412 [Chara braunii]|uniref:DUF659 domain-containing protein n=1 Tax=Chara braunii TaxID=69332 RepID=A0A388LRR8_CHABU|nr:hypothetical protein CBR_g39412 [Chara braunii]|eukprot:GBG84949.1 hypothetical protein CBR_g39412 [Chara braunii]